MSTLEISPPTMSDGQPHDTKKVKEKGVEDVEVGVSHEKQTIYSKVSVYLMMILSRLALGSDGYAFLIGIIVDTCYYSWNRCHNLDATWRNHETPDPVNTKNQ
ncbi:hypothetical protein DER44DRAFT_847869 [Fusarium oxysporum]|nr:hypothetical protein DER44DRAFT_847869 [Fusarium oxysporum]